MTAFDIKLSLSLSIPIHLFLSLYLYLYLSLTFTKQKEIHRGCSLNHTTINNTTTTTPSPYCGLFAQFIESGRIRVNVCARTRR